MRIALVSPFPPCKSGIADYSAALSKALGDHCALSRVMSAADLPQLADHDLPIFQVGNNDSHDFVYTAAIEHPGVVVLHEANLHHLIAEITIKRGDWDSYMQAVEFDGGPEALAFAQAVRRLEVGPDYDGVPMLRRLLQRTRGLIVHSELVGAIAREQGYSGPMAVIPHGAWLPDMQGAPWRERLGIADETPLVGVFGHIKPYKRIAETLRAFRRLVRGNPFARLILVGEEHPDLPLAPMLDGLDLRGHVQHIGFTPIEDFVGYMAACDVIVNLRYPTVGESSGSMLRALGLAKPVLVSDVGAFAEFPDTVCLKVPVGGPEEEDVIFEYIRYLCEHPLEARVLGDAARTWVGETCNWNRVAQLYLEFCKDVLARPVALAVEAPDLQGPAESTLATASREDAWPAEHPAAPFAKGADVNNDAGTGPSPFREAPVAEEPTAAEDLQCVDTNAENLTEATPEAETEPNTEAHPATVEPAELPDPAHDDMNPGPSHDLPKLESPLPQLESPLAQAFLQWAPNPDARSYLMQHLSRLVETIELLPQGDADTSILEMGCYMQLTPLLSDWKGYGAVRGCYYGPPGEARTQSVTAPDGRSFSCMVDTFDAERDIYPYADASFDTVVCTELFEHLSHDPIHCLAEINRILKPDGRLLLSTPNVCSARAIAAILTGYHPGFFPAFMRPEPDGEVDPRHHREYAPHEIRQAFVDCGFAVEVLRTGAYWSAPAPEQAWVEHLLEHYELDRELRGECIFALGRKTGPVVNRFPAWLYYG